MPEATPAAAPPTNSAPPAAKPAPTVVPVQPAKPATPPAEPKAAAPVADETFEITVAGEKRKMTKAELVKAASKAGFADKVAQQAKEALRVLKEREAEMAKRDSLWDDDDALEAELERRGKLDKLARKRLEKKVNEAQLTPEQQEAQREKQRADELAKKLAERDEADKKVKAEEAQRVVQAQMEKQLAEAAERAGMAKSPDSFYAIYEAVREAVELGLPWDPERIVATAQENIDGAFRRLEESTTKDLKGQALIDRLGPAVVKEVLRFKAEQLRNGGAKPQPPVAPKPAEPATYLQPSDLANKYRGGRS